VAQRANLPSPRFVAISPDDGTTIHLGNPALAAFLSWLVPGLGQLYQGRRFKAVVFMVSLMGTLVAGLWIGGGRVIYASRRWEFFGQPGIGAAAIPALVQAAMVSGPLRQPLGAAGWFAPPLLRGQVVSEAYREQIIARDPDIGPEDFAGLQFRPRQPGDESSLWRRRLGRYYDIGSLYTVLAGLLNLLVIYDAWAGPFRHEPSDDAPPTPAPGGSG
jgi:TM2 domain-containing membrane protein YozV